jgi:hypothetical protein
MAATPTSAEVLDIRADLETYLQTNSEGAKTIDDYTARALAQVIRDLEDTRNILWSRIYVDPDYLGDGRNEDRSKQMISLLAIAYVFEDYFLRTAGDTYWYDVYLHYFKVYNDLLKKAKLDVDVDDSGTITEDEEGRSGQSFMVR